ncbi:DUF4203 domain-containing protein [Nostocoides sp. F2B08]|uniref:DUF4203 domain-containing protein n=1 Tax=Nostocoides sp. F2B08 TaxID=2653936 RepID=UPI001262E2A4|nr:DUF4203 domain-containing protein [Tetrasphaera sp. F2B08]KAB7743040.1 DUF4203 domain-containing protein [Tetrasphaera sp. F2B08]
MVDIVLGLFAIVAGMLLCFGGAFALRIVFPIWGAFAGFAFGAGLVAGFADQSFLGTVLGWVLGLVFAVLFAIFAYFSYAVAVVLVMASIGFAVGSGLVVALGIDWNWVAVLAGLVLGAVLGVAAVATDMPMIVLALLSALGGAVAVVGGLMLLVGAMDTSTFTRGAFSAQIADDWWWYALVVILTVAGALFQAAKVAGMRASIRASWESSGIA